MKAELEIYVAPLNGSPRRLVRASFRGERVHVDTLDPNSAASREQFAQALLSRRPELARNGPKNANLQRIADAVLTQAELADQAELENLTAVTEAPVTYQRITAAELAAAEYRVEYLVRWLLASRQPCILAGGKKALKTTLLIDLGISLATGWPFLGEFEVPRPVRTLLMSGESGLATIQETARRIAASRGLELAEIDGLVFSPDLPRFGDAKHCAALEKMLVEDRIEVLMIDPAFLCIPTDGAESSLFAMGELLRGISEMCQRNAITLILAHHCKKTLTDPYAPPELENIAFAGFQEFTRQWILVGRRERYEPGTGIHRLWLNAGGSAGHSSCHALDVSEGAFDGVTPRHWDVSVMGADEARQAIDQRSEAAKQARADQQKAKDWRAILDVAAKFPEGQTKSALRDMSGVRSTRFEPLLAEMLSEGDLISTNLSKGNGRSYEAYKLGGEK